MQTYQIALYADQSFSPDDEDPAEFVDVGAQSRREAVDEAKRLLHKREMFLSARVVRFNELGESVDTDEVWRQGSAILSKPLAPRGEMDLAS